MARMSAERIGKAHQQLETISKEDHAKVKALAAIVRPLRSVLHKTPDDHGMTGWRDVYFPSDDGVPLEGWYIPAKGGESDKLILFNHALPMCRAGFPGHLGELWSGFDAVEIDFVLQMRHLTEASYNSLLDTRGCGFKETSTGGWLGITDKYWLTALIPDQSANITAEFDAVEKLAPSRPANPAVWSTPGAFSAMSITCRIALSVRSSEEPGGNWMTPMR